MDNILVAWSPIVRTILKTFKNPKGKKALDFGCGVGEFCYKLHQLGFTVTGIDSSPRMIKKARKYLHKSVNLVIGDSSKIPQDSSFDFIASIQTFQFIENIKQTVNNLDRALNPNGIIVFATFNPKFAINCIKEKVLLVDFDSDTKPTKGTLQLGDIRIPTYIRTAKEYDELFFDLGYSKILEEYPPLTKGFLEKYPLRVPPDKIAPAKDPEHMILGYKK